MARTDNDTWDLATSVGATATMVAAARAIAMPGWPTWISMSAGLETRQAWQQDGDQPVSVRVDPAGALRVSAGEQADLGGVHIRQ